MSTTPDIISFFFRMIYTKFEKTPVMSTYLLAFMVSKFSRQVSLIAETPVTIPVYVIGYQRNRIGLTHKYSGILLDALEKWLGVTYKELGITKLDFLAIPEPYQRSMSNWGLVTFQ